MKQSQKTRILKELKLGGWVSSISALQGQYGGIITRLASIMNILKEEGYDIESRPIKGSRNHEYRLTPKGVETLTLGDGREIKRVVYS